MNHRTNTLYTQTSKSSRANYVAHACDQIALVWILYAVYSVEQYLSGEKKIRPPFLGNRADWYALVCLVYCSSLLRTADDLRQKEQVRSIPHPPPVF